MLLCLSSNISVIFVNSTCELQTSAFKNNYLEHYFNPLSLWMHFRRQDAPQDLGKCLINIKKWVISLQAFSMPPAYLSLVHFFNHCKQRKCTYKEMPSNKLSKQFCHKRVLLILLLKYQNETDILTSLYRFRVRFLIVFYLGMLPAELYCNSLCKLLSQKNK